MGPWQILLLWVLFSFIVGFLGHGRKIGFAAALLISIILSPLIGFIIVLLSGTKEDLTDVKIAHDAGVITDEEYKEKVRKSIPSEEDRKDLRRGYIVFGIIVAAVIIIWQIVKFFKSL